MNNRTMTIWYEKIYRPYVTQQAGEAALLLDDLVCHKSEALNNALLVENSMRFMIPSNYTCVLQPCDVGIDKPLKGRLKQYASNWRRERFRSLSAGSRMPT